MNDAFKKLQSVVPDIFGTKCSINNGNLSSSSSESECSHGGGKLTKINTLKLAVNYISALTAMLKQSESSSSENAGNIAARFLNSKYSKAASFIGSVGLHGSMVGDNRSGHHPSSQPLTRPVVVQSASDINRTASCLNNANNRRGSLVPSLSIQSSSSSSSSLSTPPFISSGPIIEYNQSPLPCQSMGCSSPFTVIAPNDDHHHLMAGTHQHQGSHYTVHSSSTTSLHHHHRPTNYASIIDTSTCPPLPPPSNSNNINYVVASTSCSNYSSSSSSSSLISSPSFLSVAAAAANGHLMVNDDVACINALDYDDGLFAAHHQQGCEHGNNMVEDEDIEDNDWRALINGFSEDNLVHFPTAATSAN